MVMGMVMVLMGTAMVATALVETETVEWGESVTYEAVAAIPAIAGASKVIPAVIAGVGALGTIMQAKRKYKTRSNPLGGSKGKRKISDMEKNLLTD